MTMLMMANRFDTYEHAHERYLDFIVPEFGATRMDWGFGRWLWLDYDAAECSSLNYWRKLRDINILTADGRKRLARAEKANAAALEGSAK